MLEPALRSLCDVVGELLLLLSTLPKKQRSLIFLQTWHCLLEGELTTGAPLGFLQDLQNQAVALLALERPGRPLENERALASGMPEPWWL